MVAHRRIGVFAAAAALGGCYDLERLDPGPKSHYLLIDDFEDGDDLPSASAFASWRATGFNADNNPDLIQELEVVEATDSAFAPDSTYALWGKFSFIYPGSQLTTGVNLGVADAGRDPVDARVFRSISFSARFVPEGPPFPALTRFYVQLGCDGAPGLPGARPPFWVQHNVNLEPEWQAHSLSLDAFAELGSEDPKIDGGAKACLAKVDAVRFNVGTVLGMGESAVGSLYIDDVYFE